MGRPQITYCHQGQKFNDYETPERNITLEWLEWGQKYQNTRDIIYG